MQWSTPYRSMPLYSLLDSSSSKDDDEAKDLLSGDDDDIVHTYRFRARKLERKKYVCIAISIIFVILTAAVLIISQHKKFDGRNWLKTILQETSRYGPWEITIDPVSNRTIIIPKAIIDLPQWDLDNFDANHFLEPDGDRIANEKNLKSWRQCMKTRSCKRNQEKIIIINDMDYLNSIKKKPFMGGEGIWARSVLKGLMKEGYTLLYYKSKTLPELGDYIIKELDGWAHINSIITSGGPIAECLKEGEKCYYSSKNNPKGVQLWKVLDNHFWGFPRHPLGALWTIEPEPWHKWSSFNGSYLGYSIEDTCRSVSPIEPKLRFGSLTKQNIIKLASESSVELSSWSSEKIERESKKISPTGQESRRVAYILGKRQSYFDPSSGAMFNQDQFQEAFKQVNVRFEFGAYNDSTARDHFKIPPYISNSTMFTNHGRVSPPGFFQLLSTTSILIGIGNPAISPTPYDALCQGVPFLNPVFKWDDKNPDDRSRWRTQHDGIRHLDPPYIYHVQQNDTKGFVNAIRSAIQNPIEPFILPRMRQEEVDKRVKLVFSTNFKGEALRIYQRCIESKDEKTCYEVV